MFFAKKAHFAIVVLSTSGNCFVCILFVNSQNGITHNEVS